MKIKEYKSKIVISELEPDKEYICLVDPIKVQMETLIGALKPHRNIPVVLTCDVDQSVRFVAVPKLPWWRRLLGL